jgi:hypothetical protein
MKTKRVRCPYCQQGFEPSRFRPQQRVCSQPFCQRRRVNHYHREKKKKDPVYHQLCLESQSSWRQDHPTYMQQYRQRNPQVVDQNRQRCRQRYHQRRLGILVKNNLAFDLKAASHQVWLIGPGLEPFVKNNVAFSQVYVCQGVP